MNTDFSQPFNPEAYAPSAKTDTRFRCCVEKGMPWLYGIIFPVILGLCLYTYEKETLFRIQELNLFLPDSTFYHTLAAYPGGTLQWASCFLTQFFYYPAVGTAFLAAVWICICFVMRSPSGCPPRGAFFPLWFRQPCWPVSWRWVISFTTSNYKVISSRPPLAYWRPCQPYGFSAVQLTGVHIGVMRG